MKFKPPAAKLKVTTLILCSSPKIVLIFKLIIKNLKKPDG